MSTDVSEEHIVLNRALVAACIMLVSCFAYSLTLKMEATSSVETSVEFQRETRMEIFKSAVCCTDSENIAYASFLDWL
jgi:hypothetical protein